MERILSVTEAARLKKVSRQAIYLAIKQNKLKAYFCKDKWGICRSDLERYDEARYSRERSTCEGELIYDESKGLVSIDKAAKLIGVPAQKLYYAARIGKLRASRRNAAWVIELDDLWKYERDHLLKGSFRRYVC